MKESARKVLGKNVHVLRSKAGLTQEQMAERVDVNRRFLQRIEGGTANPGVDILLRLRNALSCKWDDLFKGL